MPPVLLGTMTIDGAGGASAASNRSSSPVTRGRSAGSTITAEAPYVRAALCRLFQRWLAGVLFD